MAIIDSVAEFTKRIDELGLTDATNAFHNSGINTLADLAFCTDYVPGSGSPALIKNDVITPILG